jgi:hypothetical protein
MNIYQWHHSEELPPVVRECMDQVKSTIAYGGRYTLVPPEHRGYNLDSNDHRCDSDVLRCMILAEDPEGCWIDTDTERVAPYIPPSDGKPYFSQAMPGWANGDVVISNGNTQVFIDLLEIYETVPHIPGWMQNAINGKLKERIGLIPFGYFRHYSLSLARHLTEGQSVKVKHAVLAMKNGEIVIAYKT